MLSRFSASSSVISSDLLRVRFMYVSKVCRVPRIVLLFRSLIKMTLFTHPSNILIISEDNYSPQNYVDWSWISLYFILFCSSGSWLGTDSQYSNFQIFSLFFIAGILFMSGGFIQFCEWLSLRQLSQIETTSEMTLLQLHFVHMQPISGSWVSDNNLSSPPHSIFQKIIFVIFWLY